MNPENRTYPTVLYPHNLLELNRLKPPLPEKPKEPNKPREPYRPSEKYDTNNNMPTGCALYPGLILLIIMFFILGNDKDIHPFVPFAAIGFTGLGVFFWYKNWTKKSDYESFEYPEKLKKYNIEMKQYQKEKQEYDINLQEYGNLCLKYEKEKKEILSANSLNSYQNRVMRERLLQSVKPSLNLTAAKKGVSENYFYSLLMEHFGGKIQTDLSFTQNGKTYFPDFIYYDSSINLIIDIEIDEPYIGYSGTPIHYIINRKDYYSEEITTSTVDDDRDRVINKGGWIIVKFAEQQIFEDASGCINFLSLVIENAKQMIFNCSNQHFLASINRWTKDEAHGMGYKRFRFSYVPEKYHALLKVDGDPLAPVPVITIEEPQTGIQNFALKYTDLFINIISSNYPLSYSLFEKYKNKLNWIGLSNNPYLPWSMELIEKYADKWDWKVLTNNNSLFWTTELLEKYKDKWDWTRLLYKNNGTSILEEVLNCREWSDEWISKMKTLWGWSYETKLENSWNKAMQLEVALAVLLDSEKPLLSYSDEKELRLMKTYHLVDTMNIIGDSHLAYFMTKLSSWNMDFFEKQDNSEVWIWAALSANEQVTWSLELIEKYMDKWDINELARNKSIYEIFKPYINISLIDTAMTTNLQKKE